MQTGLVRKVPWESFTSEEKEKAEIIRFPQGGGEREPKSDGPDFINGMKESWILAYQTAFS